MNTRAMNNHRALWKNLLRGAAALFTAGLLTGAGAQAGTVTREISDGSGTIRSISLDSRDVVVLRNFAVGQPLRMSYCLNFPLAQADEVRRMLEKFVATASASGPASVDKDLGHIGTTLVKLTTSTEAASLALITTAKTSQMTPADARQLLKCMALLPEMEAERKAGGRIPAAPIAEFLR